MSQMPQQPRCRSCPSCEEPLESGDRFCGACGYDLSAVPAPPDDSPTLTLNGAAAPAAARRPRPATAAPGLAAPRGPAPAAPTPPGPTGGRRRRRPGRRRHPAAGARPAGPRRPRRPVRPAARRSPTSTRCRRPSRADAPADRRRPRPAGTKVCVACRAGRVDRDGYCENCGHAQPRERDHMEQESGAVAAVSDRGPAPPPQRGRVRGRPHRAARRLARASSRSSATACPPRPAPTTPRSPPPAAAERVPAGRAAARHAPAAGDARRDRRRLARGQRAGRRSRPTAREHAPHQNAPACTLVGAVVTAEPAGRRLGRRQPRLLGPGGPQRAARPGSPRTTRGPRRWSPRA